MICRSRCASDVEVSRYVSVTIAMRSGHEQRRVPDAEAQPVDERARRSRSGADGHSRPRARCECSFVSNGRSIFSRRRLTSTSTMLVCGSKLYSHTCDRIIVFETTRPALRIRYSSSANSRGRRSSDLPAARHAARQQVERQVLDGQRRRLRRARGSPDERLDARQQLGEREGFGEVVVAAGLQAPHAIVHGSPRAQNQHRRGPAPAAQLVDEREAVALGQHEVDDRRRRSLGSAAASPASPSAAWSTAKPASRSPRTTKSAIVSSSSIEQCAHHSHDNGRGLSRSTERAKLTKTSDCRLPSVVTADCRLPTTISRLSRAGCPVAPRAGTAWATARRVRVRAAARSGQYGSRSSSRASSTQSACPLAHDVVGLPRRRDQPDGAGRHAGLATDPLGKRHLIARPRSGIATRRPPRRPTNSRPDRRRDREAGAPARPTARCPIRRPVQSVDEIRTNTGGRPATRRGPRPRPRDRAGSRFVERPAVLVRARVARAATGTRESDNRARRESRRRRSRRRAPGAPPGGTPRRSRRGRPPSARAAPDRRPRTARPSGRPAPIRRPTRGTARAARPTAAPCCAFRPACASWMPAALPCAWMKRTILRQPRHVPIARRCRDPAG